MSAAPLRASPLVGRRVAPVPARAPDVLAQPERGVLRRRCCRSALLAIFGAVFAGRDEDLDVIVPGIAGMSVMSATFTSLAYNLTTLRERGILKRLRGTPLPTSAYLAGLAGNAVANAALQLAIVIVVGHVLLGVSWPGDWVSLGVFAVRRRDLLRAARRRALARDPEPRVRARLRQRRLPPADPDRGRLLRRRRRAAASSTTSRRRCR